MTLLLQLSDKIGGVTLFVKGTRRGSFLFFTRQTQHKYLDVIEAWVAEAVLVFFCSEEDQDQIKAWQAHLWFFL